MTLYHLGKNGVTTAILHSHRSEEGFNELTTRTTAIDIAIDIP